MVENVPMSLQPLINEALDHKNIDIITSAELMASERRAGNFDLQIEKKPRYVKEMHSMWQMCRCLPGGSSDQWNENLMYRKSIYKPFPVCP